MILTASVSIFSNIATSCRGFMSDIFSIPITSGWLTFFMLIGAAIVAVTAYYITIAVLRLVAIIVEKTETDWDDDLINAPLLKALSLIAPALVLDKLIPLCFYEYNGVASAMHILTQFYIIWVAIYAINTFLDNLLHAFSKRKKFKPYAVKGIFQMGKLVFICVGVIIGLSILIGKSPIAILTALGASAAILMLVFKDTILGLVASVQLTANKMLRKGDWVIVDKHNANGEVIDISLTTVKIRNWDNSITTVPPYSLITDSFQNYQAMRKSGARRISRAFYVDFNSIRFLSSAEIESLAAKGYLKDLSEDENHVNLRLFRDYLENWLAKNASVRSDLLFMVRQMAPTPAGLPVEVYCFVKIVEWKGFEHIQSEIFDHIYAVAPLFGLKIFQSPSGLDIKDVR